MGSYSFNHSDVKLIDNHNTAPKTSDTQSSLVRKSKKEIYKYRSNWLISSIACSTGSEEPFRLALSSYLEKYENYITIVQLDEDDHDQNLRSQTEFAHPYPATKVLWDPSKNNSYNDRLLATSADYLRIWRINKTGANLECLLSSNGSNTKLCAPLTSFDWNDVDPSLIVTSSVDSTCSIWDLETKSTICQTPNATQKLKLVAHNHQVYDVSFSRHGTGRNLFISCGGDGAVRLFDLRNSGCSNVVYEDADAKRALVRVSCSKNDPNLVATFAMHSSEILILDMRFPGKQATAFLKNHCDSLNGISWAPHLANHLCSAADDGQALIWDVSKRNSPTGTIKPSLTYLADGKINHISWSTGHPDWVAIGYRNYLELLRI